MSRFKDDTDITYGIETTIWQAIEKAIEKNSIETFEVLNRFITKVLLESIKKDSLKTFDKYIGFLPFYYSATYLKSKEGNQFLKLHLKFSKLSARQLKEMLNYFLYYNKKHIADLNYKALEQQNRFIYKALNSFSRILYNTVNNEDVVFFDFALNEFHQLEMLSRNNFGDLRTRIKFYPEDTDDFRQQQKLYDIISQNQNYRRHVLTGVKYWAYFLYNVGKNSSEATQVYSDKLLIREDANDLLKDILLLRNKGWEGYFDWSGWDYLERPDGKSYSPPNPRDWLTFGFLIDMIRDQRYYFNIDYFNSKELQEISYMSDTIVDFSKILIDNFDKWKVILKVPSVEELKEFTNKIISIFEQFKIKNVTDKEKEIADEPISEEKVQEFIQYAGQKWERHSIFRKFFLKYENRLVNNALEIMDKKVLHIGTKVMFINGKYSQDPKHLSDIGAEHARDFDDSFIEFVSKSQSEIQEKILDCVNVCLEKLRAKNKTANLIIIPSEYSYRDQSFLNDKDFIRKYELEPASQEIFLVGEFKNIPVYSYASHQFNNKIIVCDFKDAFQMQYKEDETWYKGELKVNVSLIDDEISKTIYENNPEGWKKRIGLNLVPGTMEDALISIKNSVYIEVNSASKFEILNEESYVVGLIGSTT